MQTPPIPSDTGTQATELAASLTAALEANPVLLAPAAVFILIIVLKVLRAGSGSAPKDPSRLFSSNQRTEGFARAGGTCEMESFPFIRCRRKATHGDHWYPWSKGGSTSMDNFVAACASCNTSKGAKVPTFLATARLEKRRRGYFPTALNTAVGQRFAQR